MLTPLNPFKAYEDQVRIVKEYKVRGNKVSAPENKKSDKLNECVQKSGKTSEEKKNSECKGQNRVKNTRVSAFAVKSEKKKVCDSTNIIYLTLPRVNVSLL